MIQYQTRVCYNCRRLINKSLYLEREVRPYTYVQICKRCEPVWELLRRMEKKGLLQSMCGEGITLTTAGKLLYQQSRGSINR